MFGLSQHKTSTKKISSELCDYTLIICLPFEKKQNETDKYYRKYLAYSKLINENLVNGLLYVMTSFSSLRALINLITSRNFNQFNISKLKAIIKNKNDVSENFK